MATIPRRTRRDRVPTPAGVTNDFTARANRWWTNYRLVKKLAVEQDGVKNDPDNPGLRRQLLDEVVKSGKVIDPNGHKAITFPEPIAGLHGIKAQRKVTPQFEEMVAAGLVKKKGEDVEKACTRVVWVFRGDKIAEIVQVLDDAGILEECIEPGSPQRYLDPDLILRYHQTHPEVITEADIDLILPDKVDWAIYPLTEPLGEIGDVD